jgi:hypothetical protein
MTMEKEMITVEQAAAEITLAARRVGLLHLAFAETLVKELGDVRGRGLVVKAIRNYGQKISHRDREAALEQGVEMTPDNQGIGGHNWPAFGGFDSVEAVDVDGDQHVRVSGCRLFKAWQEFGGEELGRLYCLVDVSKMMAFNPNYKVIHLKTEPDGDPYCEMVLRETSPQEREDFANDADWSHADSP